jgi:hypothetical protein
MTRDKPTELLTLRVPSCVGHDCSIAEGGLASIAVIGSAGETLGVMTLPCALEQRRSKPARAGRRHGGVVLGPAIPSSVSPAHFATNRAAGGPPAFFGTVPSAFELE